MGLREVSEVSVVAWGLRAPGRNFSLVQNVCAFLAGYAVTKAARKWTGVKLGLGLNDDPLELLHAFQDD